MNLKSQLEHFPILVREAGEQRLIFGCVENVAHKKRVHVRNVYRFRVLLLTRIGILRFFSRLFLVLRLTVNLLLHLFVSPVSSFPVPGPMLIITSLGSPRASAVFEITLQSLP